MKDRFKFRYVFEKDFGGRTGLCYKMPIFNLDNPTEFSAEVIVGETFCNLIMEYEKSGYKLKAKQQCTGLKDKNGKLIFEGDIVKVGNNIFEIVFEIGSFMLATKTNDEVIHNFVNSWNDNVYPLSQLYFEYENEEYFINQLEVIGNIYENPELFQDNPKRLIGRENE